jgi:4-alpha-glucanotransferase
MADTGYAWWVARLQAILELVDIVRLEHFRGLESYSGRSTYGGAWDMAQGPWRPSL